MRLKIIRTYLDNSDEVFLFSEIVKFYQLNRLNVSLNQINVKRAI